MDKGSETANDQVAVAPVVRRKEKSGNNGKRNAAEALEKTISAKRKKIEAEVKKVQAPPPKEEESTSTEEDTYSDEEEEVEAEVKMVQVPPPKEKEYTSTEEDTYSESEEEEKVEAEVKKVQAPPPKEEESTSTEEDTYSESEEEEKVEAEVKKVQAPPQKEEEYTSTEEDIYSESEEEEKVEAEVKKVQAPPPKEEESTSTKEDAYSESEEEEKVEAEVKKVQAPPQKEEEYTSTEEDIYSESEEEEKVEAEVKKVQAPPHKEKESTSTEEDTYSESEEEEKVEAEVKKVQTPPPKEEESTSTEDAYSESEEEEKVEAEVKKVQVPPSKEEESTSTKEDTYSESKEEEVSMQPKNSESKEEEVSMQPKTPIGNQSEHGVARIFVGNLPSKVDEDDIAALFKEAGEVIEVRLARWKLLKDNNSKGFCHVEFATEEAAKRALEMNQQEFMGCELRVQLAKPEKRRKDNSSIHKGEDEPKTRVGNKNEHGMATIFVTNLPFTANEDEIAAFFKEAGEVIEVRLSRGYCHVEFATEEAAKRALEMKHEFMGRELILDMGIPEVSSTCRRKKKSRIHMGEDEPKTRVGNQNEHGMATIFVSNLPSIAIEYDIAAFFKEAGEVIEVRLPRNRDRNSRGYCHVEFATEEAAKRALEMKHEFMGRKIRLDMGTRKVSSTHSSGQGNRREHGGGYRGHGGDRGRGGGRGQSW